MGVQTQVLQALSAMLETLLGIPAHMGPLPSQAGLAMAAGAGSESEPTLAGGRTVALDVALSMKHPAQQTALDTLCRAHEALARTDGLPLGEGWQVISITTASAPGYLDRTGDMWLYGSALRVVYAAE